MKWFSVLDSFYFQVCVNFFHNLNFDSKPCCAVKKWTEITSDGFGSNIFDPGWGQIFAAWVRLAAYLVWVKVWKISPKNSKFSIICPAGQKKSHQVGSKSTWVKAGSASYLLKVKSMLGSGQVL